MKLGKKKKLYAMLLVVGLVCSMTDGAKTDAKKLITHKYTAQKGSKLVVATNTNYKISQIAKDVKDAETGTKLSKIVKKGKIKWSSSDKNLKVTGSRFKAKKSGTYKLIGTAKKNKYVVTLDVVEKNYAKDLSNVAYIVIRSGSDGSSVKIEDEEMIRTLCGLIQTANFTFDYDLAKKGAATGWSYAVKLYSADGEEQYSMVNDKPVYYYTSSKSDEIYAYVQQCFQNTKTSEPQTSSSPISPSVQSSSVPEQVAGSDEIKLQIDNFNQETKNIQFSVTNMTDSVVTLPSFYTLEKCENDIWLAVPRKTDSVRADAMMVMSKDKVTMEANLNSDYENLSDGQYRICIQTSCGKAFAEFALCG